MKGPLDSRQLQAFVILARTGSFTLTAREMFLTQSAVSHAMKALEGDVGCRLLDRMGKRVSLTQAGEHLLHHAEKILAEMSQARAGLEQLGKWGHSRLRVVAPATICATLLPGIVHELKKQFPQCALHVEPGDSVDCLNLLEHGKADLALTLEQKPDDRFDFLPAFTDELVFIAAPSHPWAAAGRAPREEIPRQNLIVYGRNSQTWRLMDAWFQAEGIVPNAAIELRSMEAIKELVKLNLGVGIAAPWIAQRELAERSLVALPLGRRKLRRQWGILHLRGRRLALVENFFVQCASRLGGAMPRELAPRAGSPD